MLNVTKNSIRVYFDGLLIITSLMLYKWNGFKLNFEYVEASFIGIF